MRGQRDLQPVFKRDRGRRGGVAVHGCGRAEHRIAAIGLAGDELAEIVDGAGADGDDRFGRLQPVGEIDDRGHIGMRMVEDDGFDRAEALQRRGNARAHGIPGIVVGHDRKALTQLQRGDEIGFGTVEALLDDDFFIGNGRGLARFRIDPAARQHVVDQRGPAANGRIRGHRRLPCRFHVSQFRFSLFDTNDNSQCQLSRHMTGLVDK